MRQRVERDQKKKDRKIPERKKEHKMRICGIETNSENRTRIRRQKNYVRNQKLNK